MANALPILLLGGAALMMMGGKKKTRPSSGTLAAYPPDIPKPPPLSTTQKTEMSGYGNVSRQKMQWIQTALVINGYDPGVPDGVYTAQTKQAVWEFQEDWGGLTVDGKPGKNTQTALKKAETAAAKEAPKAPASKDVGQVCGPGKQFVILPPKEKWGDTEVHRWWKFCNYGNIQRLYKFIPQYMALEISSAGLKAQEKPSHFRGGGVYEEKVLVKVSYNGPVGSLEAGRIIAIAMEVGNINMPIAVLIKGAKTPATTAAIEAYGPNGKWGLQADLVLSGYFKGDLETIAKKSKANKA